MRVRRAMLRLRRLRLNRQARVQIDGINDLLDRYDCGGALIDHITGGRLTDHRRKLDQIVAKIDAINAKLGKESDDS